MIQFDENYFLPEDREGEHLKSMQKRYYASTMESLEQVDKICKRHGIKYFAYYGTLLGAVRHKGFIPWDDDMDIAMLRKDYDRFVKYAKKELEDPFILYNVDDSCLFPMRINNTWYTQMKPEFLERFHYCPYATGIDIFVLDKIPENDLDQEVLRTLYQCVRFVAQSSDHRFEAVHGSNSEFADKQDKFNEILDGIEQFTGVTFTRDDTLAHQLTVLTHQIGAMYEKDYARYVTKMSTWTIHPDWQNMPIHCFDETIELPFENISIPVPKEYERVLKILYGENYMTPYKGGGAHKTRWYFDQEEELLDIFKKCNAEPPEFLFE